MPLFDVARTRDVHVGKAIRKAVDATLKDTTKELKSLLELLQSSSQASHILPKVGCFWALLLQLILAFNLLRKFV